MSRPPSAWHRGAAIGGAVFLAIVLGSLIKLLGLFPLVLSNDFDVQYRFIAYPPPGATASSFQDFEDGGMVFRCESAPSTSGANLRDVTCRAIDTDGSGYSLLFAAIERRGWTVVETNGGIQMTSSAAPDAQWVAVVCILFLALAWGLVRATSAGWGVRELIALRWKAPLLLLVPLGLVMASGAMVAALVFGSQGAAAGIGAPPADQQWALGATLLLLLPVLAAVPEEALFRGWLHERLFSRVSPWVAYLVVAEVFVLMHAGVVVAIFSGGAQGGLAVFQVVMIFLVSLALTWIRRAGGSLLLCVFAHATYNAVLVAANLS